MSDEAKIRLEELKLVVQCFYTTTQSVFEKWLTNRGLELKAQDSEEHVLLAMLLPKAPPEKEQNRVPEWLEKEEQGKCKRESQKVAEG